MRAAVIPTTGRDDLADCISAISLQVDEVILVTHNVDLSSTYGASCQLIPYPTEGPPNISEMWNKGLDLASYMGAEYVAVLNDDAIVYRNWFERLAETMRYNDAAAGWSSGRHPGHLIYRKAEPTMIRMTGFAFMVKSSMRADQQFQWWFGDNDLEWRARENGGVVHVGGDVEHRHPNGYTEASPELSRIAGEDRERFLAKWGRLP